MKKNHVLCKGTLKFAITRQLQIILCLLGQSKVFGEASELLEKLLGIPISGMQIHRVCDYYGDKVDKAITRNKEISIGKLQDVKKEDNVYCYGRWLYVADAG